MSGSISLYPQFESVTGSVSAEKDKTLDIFSKLHKPDVMDKSKVF